jgi:hypothetical protein
LIVTGEAERIAAPRTVALISINLRMLSSSTRTNDYIVRARRQMDFDFYQASEAGRQRRKDTSTFVEV